MNSLLSMVSNTRLMLTYIWNLAPSLGDTTRLARVDAEDCGQYVAPNGGDEDFNVQVDVDHVCACSCTHRPTDMEIWHRRPPHDGVALHQLELKLALFSPHVMRPPGAIHGSSSLDATPPGWR